MNNTMVSREVFDGFGGLKLSSPRGNGSCRLDNFRVLADGSLQSREGIRLLASLPEEIRGIYAFSDGEEEILLAVAGNSLYRISPANGTVVSASCFDTCEGRVTFFVWGGQLYIVEGIRLWRYSGGCTVTRIYGYTPLYGKNWNPYSEYSNQVNEPINYLSPRVRIQYQGTGSIDYVYIGLKISSIEWVKSGKQFLENDWYYIDERGDIINFTSPVPGSRLEVCVRIDEQYFNDDAFFSSVSSAIYDDFDKSRLFLYGGQDVSRLFISCLPNEEEKIQDAQLFSDSCGLYFPKDRSLVFMNEQPITAIHRLYDRMMVFFPTSLWISESMETAMKKQEESVLEDNLLFTPFCDHMGCSAKNAFLMTGASSPITVTLGGIYQWKIDPEFLEECVIKCLSNDVLPLLGETFFKNAEVCFHRRRSELWFRDTANKNGRIFLYHLERGIWYCYCGIEADRLFSFEGGIGYTNGGKVCLFDEHLHADSFTGQIKEIEAFYESGQSDFGNVGCDKRFAGAVLTAELNDGALSIGLEGDKEMLSKLELKEKDAAAIDIYEPRMPTGRFRTARLTLFSKGTSGQRIYRAELLAQKGK